MLPWLRFKIQSTRPLGSRERDPIPIPVVSSDLTTDRRSLLRFLLPTLLLLTLGCEPPAPAEAVVTEAPTAASEGIRAGEIHDGGLRHRVVPFVLHPHEMDLRVSCLVQRDQARKAGAPVRPLCFDEDRRPTPPKGIRVEYRMGMKASEAMAALSAAGEAAHFLVEATGTIYQVLDLAHGVRRGGEIEADEIRVMSGNTGGSDTLIASLHGHYGPLPVEVVPAPPAPRRPPPPSGITP
jgi:hypothetical protein